MLTVPVGAEYVKVVVDPGVLTNEVPRDVPFAYTVAVPEHPTVIMCVPEVNDTGIVAV
jgi:hypothetical protein